MADSVAEHIAALDDEDWGVREDAAVALGQFSDPRSVQPLIRALRDSDHAVRVAATSSLNALGQPLFCLWDFVSTILTFKSKKQRPLSSPILPMSKCTNRCCLLS